VLALECLRSKGWEDSANAWIAAMGERGDFGRKHVLDPVMMERIAANVSSVLWM
jgi:hypothetical protein